MHSRIFRGSKLHVEDLMSIFVSIVKPYLGRKRGKLGLLTGDVVIAVLHRIFSKDSGASFLHDLLSIQFRIYSICITQLLLTL